MSNQPIRSLHDIITLQNTDTEDFTFEYDRSRGNYPYTIKAGQVARFPRFLAEHALKHLIDKILTKKKVKTNNEAARAEVRSKIVIGEEIFQQAPDMDENTRLRTQVEKLNEQSDLEKVLSKAKVKAPAPEKEDFAGLEDDRKAKSKGFAGGTVDTTEEAPLPTPKAQPTRQELLNYAETKLGMVLDKKTMEKLDKMSDEQLVTEFQYPTE